MARLFRIILVLTIISPFVSCSKEDDNDSGKVSKRTIILFMPYSGMQRYFAQNISDWKTAIGEGILHDERVVACISSSVSKASMIELRYIKGKGVADTLSVYEDLNFTSQAGIEKILHDVSVVAPAESYAIIIGGHGSGWLPAGTSVKKSLGSQTADSQIGIETVSGALENSGLKFDYILFDDCYMSNIESVYEFKDVVDYIIGCPTEIMIYGFPYLNCAQCLVGDVDYEGLCDKFIDFYSDYDTPCATIGVTKCGELDSLASIFREINVSGGFDLQKLDEVQKMDGYDPTLFWDLGDYVGLLCTDEHLREIFRRQLERAVPFNGHTKSFYCERSGYEDIATFCGVSISAPTETTVQMGLLDTKWWRECVAR